MVIMRQQGLSPFKNCEGQLSIIVEGNDASLLGEGPSIDSSGLWNSHIERVNCPSWYGLLAAVSRPLTSKQPRSYERNCLCRVIVGTFTVDP